VAALELDDGRLQEGRLQERVAIWSPAMWLKITRVLKPLAKKRSYSDWKSAVDTAGVGQAGPSTLADAPPLTTFAHVAVGETWEVGRQGGVCVSWHPAGPVGKPATREEGEAWRAWRVDRHLAELLPSPSPAGGGGGDNWRGGRQSVGRAPSPSRVSSVLTELI
jgi:hypothetical protein